MRQLIRKIAIIWMMLLLIEGCNIIFEEDISGEEVYIIMPVDGTTSVYESQVFWWETIRGAIKYNLEIVEGSFFKPLSLIADTNVTGDKFEIALIPGNYEWRIQAWNNYSETEYFYNTLTISDTAMVNEK